LHQMLAWEPALQGFYSQLSQSKHLRNPLQQLQCPETVGVQRS
jgi:hypothetical protein